MTELTSPLESVSSCDDDSPSYSRSKDGSPLGGIPFRSPDGSAPGGIPSISPTTLTCNEVYCLSQLLLHAYY